MSSSPRMAKAARFCRNTFAALGAAMLVVTFTPLTGVWANWLTGNRWDEPAGDTLIVLGGEPPHADGGMMGPNSYWRSVSAVRALRAAHFRSVVLTGGEKAAESMAGYMTAHGVPAPLIRLENRATSTVENARFTAELLRSASPGKVALLSSDFHMRRAVAVFEKAGFRDLVVLPAPDARKRALNPLLRWQVFVELVQETGKLAWYRGNGYI